MQVFTVTNMSNLSSRYRSLTGRSLPDPVYTAGRWSNLLYTTGQWQLDAGQDAARVIESDDHLIVVVLDGHSKNTVVSWLRNLRSEDWIQAIEEWHAEKTASPVESIERLLADTDLDTWGSGACCAICLFTRGDEDTAIDVWSVGDCSGGVLVDDELRIVLEHHTMSMEGERERVTRMHANGASPGEPLEETDSGLVVIEPLPGSTRPRGTLGPIARTCFYREGRAPACLQMTRCIGHSGLTGQGCFHAHVKVSKESDLKVLIATDGVGDMCGVGEIGENCMKSVMTSFNDAPGVTEWAAQRWLGDWDCVIGEKESVQRGLSPDDIGVVCVGSVPTLPTPTLSTKALQATANARDSSAS